MKRFYRRKKKSSKPVDWKRDVFLKARMKRLVEDVGIDWVDVNQIHTFRSMNSSSNAIARIWGLNKVWQMALDARPTYIIEIISERFDKLSEREKDEVILHEIAHIPRNFSGALMAHSHQKGAFHDKLKIFLASYKKL